MHICATKEGDSELSAQHGDVGEAAHTDSSS